MDPPSTSRPGSNQMAASPGAAAHWQQLRFDLAPRNPIFSWPSFDDMFKNLTDTGGLLERRPAAGDLLLPFASTSVAQVARTYKGTNMVIFCGIYIFEQPGAGSRCRFASGFATL